MITTNLLIVLVVLFCMIYPIAVWLTHCSMTKESDYPVNKRNFENFKTKFELIKDWEQIGLFPNSLFYFDENKESLDAGFYKIAYIHATVIIFNEEAMLLGPIDYLQASSLVKKKIRELNKNK